MSRGTCKPCAGRATEPREAIDMGDFGWKADGIERAMACGGVPLETYTRPGFTRGKAVRRIPGEAGGAGFPVATDYLWPDLEPDIEIIGRRDPER